MSRKGECTLSLHCMEHVSSAIPEITVLRKGKKKPLHAYPGGRARNIKYHKTRPARPTGEGKKRSEIFISVGNCLVITWFWAAAVVFLQRGMRRRFETEGLFGSSWIKACGCLQRDSWWVAMFFLPFSQIRVSFTHRQSGINKTRFGLSWKVKANRWGGKVVNMRI